MNLYNFTVKDINENEINLAQYKNHVVLIVNTASKCGFTKQLGELQELYNKYKDQKFVVLAFPCNDFGFQEPGKNQEILEFYKNEFNVEFPIMQKIISRTHPLFEWIKTEASEGPDAITWNFTKFLFDKNGNYVRRFNHDEPPAVCESYIQTLL